MDEELVILLNKSNLIHLHSHLAANGVDDIKTLKHLLNESVEFKLLIPSVGDRLKLKNALLDTTISLETSSVATENSFSLDSTSNKNELASCSTPAGSSSVTEIIWLDGEQQQYTEVARLVEPPTKRSKIECGDTIPNTELLYVVNNEVTSFPLKKILEDTRTGQAILALYESKNELDSLCQSYLTDIIAQHFLNLGNNFRRLTNEDFNILSKKIIELFPKEAQEVYYIPPIRKKFSRENKAGVSRGKLVDKYRNRLSFIRKAFNLSQSSHSLDEPRDEQISESQEDDIIWLQNHIEPWSEVTEKWVATYPSRIQYLRGEVTLTDILRQYPILKHPKSYLLIEHDFKARYPNSYGKVFPNFEKVCFKLLEIRGKILNQTEQIIVQLIEDKSLLADTRHYLLTTLLASLLPPKASQRKGKLHWRPTSSEAKDGVVVHVKIPGDITKCVTEKSEKLSKFKLPLMPFIIIEGATYTAIKHVYVSFLDQLIELPSFLKALDVCFQLTHSLNLQYQYESEHIWMFLQLAVYDLKTVYDNIPGILDLVKKIENRT